DLAAARAHYMKAAAAFSAARYDEAASEFTAAHAAKPDPSLYYNIAQSHRLAGHRVEALINYHRYLDELPNAENRAECEAHIIELTPPPVVEKPQVVEKPPPVVEKPPPIVETQAKPMNARDRTFKIAGGALIAGAVVCLALGGGFGVLAQNTGDEL